MQMTSSPNSMERHMCMWRGVDRLAFTFGDQPNGLVNRLASVGGHVFVATTANDLYHGEVEMLEDNGPPKLTLRRAQFDVVDMAANSEHLFIVNASGHVLKIDPQDMSVVDTIVLREEVRCCVHGYRLENEVVKVKSLAVSDNSALFVTESGQLWASGDQPQIDVTGPDPRKVTFFEGRTVSHVACGVGFQLVTARRAAKSLKDDTDSENELEDVFVNSCPQCVSNAMPSPTSVTSSDTCPMLHSQQFSENRSTNSLSALSIGSRDPDNVLNDSMNRPDLENGDATDISDLNKDERRNNVIFINTEAARQFLTRQLSWVSSYGSVKEDALPLENMDRPTRLIKQNVSNMASFVYEGVKNVGGKVVTLSRHMSGSSEINDIRDEEPSDATTTEGDQAQRQAPTTTTTTSLALSLRCEEFPWSSSTESSEHELSQQGLIDRISTLARNGANLLATETWTWGDVRYGQLGTGDIIKRARPVAVTKLANTGVRAIATGDYHALALTLDGRVFAWGRNEFKQCAPGTDSDQSSPQLFTTQLCDEERAKAVAAGASHSLIMMHHGLYFVGRSNKPGEMFHLDVPTSPDQCTRQLLSSGRYSCCAIANHPPVNVGEDLAREQIYLEEILAVQQWLVKPLQKRGGGATCESNVYETLCRCHAELTALVALNVASLWDHLERAGEAYEVTLVAGVDEYTAVYRRYVGAICDIHAIGGFAQIAKIAEVPQVLVNLLTDRLKPTDHAKKISNEACIGLALQHPLRGLNRYKSLIQSLIRVNGTRMGLERLQEALIKWEQVCEEQERRQRDAEATRLFWESSGKLLDSLRSPQRRLIRESRSHPIAMLNSGRFSSHWFVLLTDIFIHVTGASHTVHPLRTMWVEPLSDTESLQNAISVVTPEENLVLLAPSATERSDWLHALQNAIKCSLQRAPGPAGHAPPIARSGSFTFAKHVVFKDAKYNGRWLNGKPHGSGKLQWSDGRVYVGQFHKGVIQGNGRMEIPSQGIYEGQWKDGQQNGYGTMKYVNGDFYEGYFKDGLPHGHGVKKEGHFMASVASVYIGEWAAGMKQGYGIMDDIMTGEKYLGSWSNGMKHGCGLIVTLDGIYYEGVFMQDVLTGHGIMIFEDGTHYEGEFKSAGIFYGKGTLTFRSGDKLEGNMNGAWNEGVKVIATLHMNKANTTTTNTKPMSFGKLCVSPDQKWKAIFRQCYQQLGVFETSLRTPTLVERSTETQRVWQNVAALITKSHQRSMERKKLLADDNSPTGGKEPEATIDQLDKIPCFGRDKLTSEAHEQIRDYLTRAFESPHHPLGALLTEVAAVYTATYGGVRVHPLLLSHAVSELHSITGRVYDIVTRLFPALPPPGKEFVLEGKDDEEHVITSASLLHPILLPRVHSALFVLYALHNKKEDDAYWERLIKWNKQPDVTLMAFLEIDQKFWKNAATSGIGDSPLPTNCEPFFSEAVETLQQLKTTFSPLEKLQVVRNTFEQMTQAVQKQLGLSYLWTMDELFPVFSFVVVRASVLQLGSEIHFIEDFMEPYLQNGELGIMFTTLKACYYQILQEKTNMSD